MGQRKRIARHANGVSATVPAALTTKGDGAANGDSSPAVHLQQGSSPPACQAFMSHVCSVPSLGSDGCACSEGTVRASCGNGVLTEEWQNGSAESKRGDACDENTSNAAAGGEDEVLAKGSQVRVSSPCEDKSAAASAVASSNRDGSAKSNLRTECEKALLALRRGNSTKSLRLIREACTRNEANALAHRVRGHICMRLASMIEDSRTKQRHLKESLEAAKKAVALSPNSVEYAHFHAQLLYDAASDSKEYQEVVKECERGLSIEDPVDPAKESLQEEGQHELPTPKARITHFQQELRGLVQKANIASISTWMKSLGNGSDDKLRFIQMRKIGEDPLEHCILQPKRPNEVKKSVKTPEERRKEIEVRVAAARLLQHRTEVGSQTVLVDSSLESDKTAPRRPERRKSNQSNVRKSSKVGDSEEKMEQVRSFWHSCNPHVRESLLQVPLTGLKAHLMPSKSSMSMDTLNEALMFAEEKKTWRFWGCCRCGERFTENQEHINHVMQEHIGSLSLKLQSILPQSLENQWVDQLMEDDCTPIDGCAAIKLLIKSSVITVVDDSVHGSLCSAASNGCFDCLSEASEGSISPTDSSLEQFVDPACNSTDTLDEKVNMPGLTVCLLHLKDDIEEAVVRPSFHLCCGDCQRDKSILWRPLEMPIKELPLVDDEDRKKLLERIYGIFRTLIRSKCLAMDHVIKIVHYAIEEIQNMVPDPNVHYNFHHSPLYVRFLSHQPLKRVHKFLCELVHACGVDRYQNEAPASNSPLNLENLESDIIQDRLYLDEEFTKLNLDERVMKEISELSLQEGRIKGAEKSGKKRDSSKELETAKEALSLMRPKDSTQKVIFPDLQLSWVYGSAEYEQQPDAWKQLQEDRAHHGREILRALEKEFLQLQHLCERKHEAISYEEALSNAESLCLKETRKRELRADGICRSYEIVLKKRHQELMGRRASGLSYHEKLELDALANILRDAQTVQVPRFSYANSLSASSARLIESDDEDEDPWHIQDSMQGSDSCIEATIQRQRDSLFIEVSQLDAKITKSMDSLQKLEQKLGTCSVFDYRSVVLPLVKSFVKARLELAAKKDALQKSDAAREAFLEELAKDKKSVINRGPDVGKQARDKMKEKKRSKELRRGKDVKLRGPSFGCGEFQQAEANGVSEEEEEVEDGPFQETSNSFANKEKQWQVVELRHLVELEVEERKLNEALELQRRVEEEAKEKHLAQQRRKLDEESLSLVRAHSHGSYSQIDSTDAGEEKQHDDENLHSKVSGETIQMSLSDSASSQELRAVDYAGNLTSCQVSEKVLEESPIPMSVGSESLLLNHVEYEQPTAVRLPTMMIGLDPGGVVVTSKLAAPSHSKKFNSKSRRRRGQQFHAEEVSGSSANSGLNSQLPLNNAQISSRAVTSKPSILAFTPSSKSSNEEMNKVMPSIIKVPPAPLLLLHALSSDDTKSMKHFQVEQDDEERFQADLEQAMQQSLDLLHVQSPRDATMRVESIRSVFPDTAGISGNQNFSVSIPGDILITDSEEVGKGLQNEVGQYNCFLNVVIQSLWHLKRFREELLATSSIEHMHVGDPCVVCALRNIFIGLNSELSSPNSEAVAPTGLRVALSAMYAESDFFQEAQMNDASEVLAVIYDCLHKAFTPNSGSDDDSDGSTAGGSWDCQDSSSCIVHSLFGLDIAEQMNCKSCGLESRHLKYTSFFHNINASALRTAKIMYPDSSLDELLKYMDMNHHLACDVESGGCGRQNYIHHLLRVPPHVFTTVLGWQNGQENLEDISATIGAIDMDVDVGIIYRGLDEGYKHRLVSVVCYYGQHYHCFAYNYDLRTWVMFDDVTVKVVGEWDAVVGTCRRGHLQPQVLFYEAISL